MKLKMFVTSDTELTLNNAKLIHGIVNSKILRPEVMKLIRFMPTDEIENFVALLKPKYIESSILELTGNADLAKEVKNKLSALFRDSGIKQIAESLNNDNVKYRPADFRYSVSRVTDGMLDVINSLPRDNYITAFKMLDTIDELKNYLNTDKFYEEVLGVIPKFKYASEKYSAEDINNIERNFRGEDPYRMDRIISMCTNYRQVSIMSYLDIDVLEFIDKNNFNFSDSNIETLSNIERYVTGCSLDIKENEIILSDLIELYDLGRAKEINVSLERDNYVIVRGYNNLLGVHQIALDRTPSIHIDEEIEDVTVNISCNTPGLVRLKNAKITGCISLSADCAIEVEGNCTITTSSRNSNRNESPCIRFYTQKQPKLYIKGITNDSELNLYNDGSHTPFIGVPAATGLSYGRWSVPGIELYREAIKIGCKINCFNSVIENSYNLLEIGCYGVNFKSEWVKFVDNGSINGKTELVDLVCTVYDEPGSTKLSEPAVYEPKYGSKTTQEGKKPVIRGF